MCSTRTPFVFCVPILAFIFYLELERVGFELSKKTDYSNMDLGTGKRSLCIFLDAKIAIEFESERLTVLMRVDKQTFSRSHIDKRLFLIVNPCKSLLVVDRLG